MITKYNEVSFSNWCSENIIEYLKKHVIDYIFLHSFYTACTIFGQSSVGQEVQWFFLTFKSVLIFMGNKLKFAKKQLEKTMFS